MRTLFVLLVCVTLCLGDGLKDEGNSIPGCDAHNDKRAYITCYMENKSIREELSTTIQKLFSDSLTYLFTSYKFASQNKEKPGLAKYMRKLSDEAWEDGMAYLKKFAERGGTWTSDLSIEAEDLTDGSNGDEYLCTLRKTLKKFKEMAKKNNMLNRKALPHGCGSSKQEDLKCSEAGVTKCHHYDAEFARFFSDKMHENTEKIRELVGHIVDLERMPNSGMALTMFDGNL